MDPLSSPAALTGTRIQSSTRPGAGPSGNQRAAGRELQSSAHQAQGNPCPAPPTSPKSKKFQLNKLINVSCSISFLNKHKKHSVYPSEDDSTDLQYWHICFLTLALLPYYGTDTVLGWVTRLQPGQLILKGNITYNIWLAGFTNSCLLFLSISRNGRPLMVLQC